MKSRRNLLRALRYAKVNVDEQPELAQQFQVMSIPTLLVMKDGEAGSQFCRRQTPSSLS